MKFLFLGFALLLSCASWSTDLLSDGARSDRSSDARPASWPHRQSCRPQTRTLDGSVRTTPPWLSSPTSLLRSGFARIRVPVRHWVGQIKMPNWARSEYRNHSSADLSTRAVPNHPGRSSECICLLLPRWYCPGFILLGGLATFSLLTRPNRVYVMLRLTCSPPKFRRPQYRDPRSVRLHVEQAITW